jgi:hypothetical protein
MTIGLRHPELFRSVASLSGLMVERELKTVSALRWPGRPTFGDIA